MTADPGYTPTVRGSPRIAVYPGSFDPFTLGHVDIVERAAKLFDRVIVAVGTHPKKKGTFSVAERLEMIAGSVGHVEGVSSASFEGLAVEFCTQQGACAIVRGLRATGDFEGEFRMAMANRDLAPPVETVFLVPSTDRMFISSSMVREIAGHGGDFARYVTPAVAPTVRARFGTK